MKLKNKKTGEIAEASILNFELVVRYEDGRVEKYPLLFDYSNFEYYEEPKEYWYISAYGNLAKTDVMTDLHRGAEEIGNLFDTKEEAEKVVEKLKAWKRLKDKGFRFKNDSLDICCHTINFKVDRQFDMTDETSRDLHLLFRGEE